MMNQAEINRAFVRGARAMLGWRQDELAKYSQVGISTIRDLERGARETERETLMKLFETFQKRGITFRQTGNSIAVERQL